MTLSQYNIVDVINQALTWGSAVGISFTAGILAISLLSYLYNRGN